MGYFTGLIPACKTNEDFSRIAAAMAKEGISTTNETLSSIISACGKNGGLRRAFQLFHELRQLTEQNNNNKRVVEPQHSSTHRVTIPKPNLTSLVGPIAV